MTPYSGFYKMKAAKDGLHSVCKECHKEYNDAKLNKYHNDELYRSQILLKSKERYHSLPTSTRKEKARINWLKTQYGLTKENYIELCHQQDNKCAICSDSNKLVVDHDHITGKIRGLLCQACNGAIGKLGDNVEGVMRAVKYLSSTNIL